MEKQLPDIPQPIDPDSGAEAPDVIQAPEEQTALLAPSGNSPLSDIAAEENIPGPDETATTPSDDSSSTRRSGRQKSRNSRTPEPQAQVSAASWFVTLMCMNIPIIGWLYLIILAFSKSAGAKRGFARAYLLYKFIFILITLAILAVAVHYGMIYLDMLLSYMEML